MVTAQANASGKAKWTVMVYMAGDNNLDGAATTAMPPRREKTFPLVRRRMTSRFELKRIALKIGTIQKEKATRTGSGLPSCLYQF
jgi:hypothetical protein